MGKFQGDWSSFSSLRTLPIRTQNVYYERRVEKNSKLRSSDQIERETDLPMRISKIHCESNFQSAYKRKQTQGEEKPIIQIGATQLLISDGKVLSTGKYSSGYILCSDSIPTGSNIMLQRDQWQIGFGCNW